MPSATCANIVRRRYFLHQQSRVPRKTHAIRPNRQILCPANAASSLHPKGAASVRVRNEVGFVPNSFKMTSLNRRNEPNPDAAAISVIDNDPLSMRLRAKTSTPSKRQSIRRHPQTRLDDPSQMPRPDSKPPGKIVNRFFIERPRVDHPQRST
jgi:hypothetical protein